MGSTAIVFVELNAGQSFQTPEMILSYSSQGLNKMSQIHHELLRERIARGRHQFAERPILVNNWEATYFDFNSEKSRRSLMKQRS